MFNARFIIIKNMFSTNEKGLGIKFIHNFYTICNFFKINYVFYLKMLNGIRKKKFQNFPPR